MQVWATRAGVDIVRAQEGSDAAAVVFDALTAAKARGIDTVLVDTAGRLHTRVNLMAGAHHERLDGRGYPKGLSGDQIALETRIITVADVFDAITAARPYRGAIVPREALEIMERTVGPALDPEVFAALARIVPMMERRSILPPPPPLAEAA